MLNKFTIIIWMIRNKYFLHLFYSIIFFLKKKFSREINFKEKYSFKVAKNLCEKYLIKHYDLYFFFSKKKKFKIKKIPNINESRIKKKLGGGSDIVLIYNLICLLKPKKIIEFGVANGWSTLSILLGCKKNGFGKLVSIDMPYYFVNAEKNIGDLIEKKKYPNWKLLIGPQVNFIDNFTHQKYDFCHYDSDKSYQGRLFIYEKVWKILKKNGVLLSDDISDNIAFFDFCEQKKRKPLVVKFYNKYLGLLIK
jgi:predicted O-methyltransferase YrrM